VKSSRKNHRDLLTRLEDANGFLIAAMRYRDIQAPLISRGQRRPRARRGGHVRESGDWFAAVSAVSENGSVSDWRCCSAEFTGRARRLREDQKRGDCWRPGFRTPKTHKLHWLRTAQRVRARRAPSGHADFADVCDARAQTSLALIAKSSRFSWGF